MKLKIRVGMKRKNAKSKVVKATSILEIAAKLAKLNFESFDVLNQEVNQRYYEDLIAKKVDQIRKAIPVKVIGEPKKSIGLSVMEEHLAKENPNPYLPDICGRPECRSPYDAAESGDAEFCSSRCRSFATLVERVPELSEIFAAGMKS